MLNPFTNLETNLIESAVSDCFTNAQDYDAETGEGLYYDLSHALHHAGYVEFFGFPTEWCDFRAMTAELTQRLAALGVHVD